MRIIHDTPDITVIQYSNETFDRVLVQIFTNIILQDNITVYPVVEKDASYRFSEQTLSSEEITESGIKVGIRDINCVTLDLYKV